jgi:hypothetical protein
VIKQIEIGGVLNCKVNNGWVYLSLRGRGANKKTGESSTIFK